ncbi:MAG: histidinol-phosphatase [Spirochaetales bacterium]|uniref:Histidinol-phosphatase n=1 Tax=Candidatus Thalassospirochaeta sargassi TaxID=3119039 RepID=A0AAJ1ICG9_9SPIO|nr:histidinol-phosphatase [Spirochaetales bacterium]
MKEKIESVQKYNLHTHTYRCKHAEGDVMEYAAEASERGIEVLGFSEHPPLHPEDIWTPFRMEEDELDDYFQAISDAREQFPQMKILAGFEMDLYPGFKSYYEDTFLHREDLDYLIGGVHWIKYRGEWMWIQKADTAGHLIEYVKEITGLIESGLMSFITHPDSFAYGYLEWDADAEACSRDILSAAEEYNVPLEINGYGLRKPDIDTPAGPRKAYPLNKFWELASGYDVTVVCNSDAHRPGDVAGGLDGCHRIIEQFHLKHHPVAEAMKEVSSPYKVLNR